MIKKELLEGFEKEIIEASNGKAQTDVGDPCWCAVVDGEVIVF